MITTISAVNMHFNISFLNIYLMYLVSKTFKIELLVHNGFSYACILLWLLKTKHLVSVIKIFADSFTLTCWIPLSLKEVS